MGRPKKTEGKTERTVITPLQKAIKRAKERLPSARSKLRCAGCYAPRNTLTVKGNLNHIWHKEQLILIMDDKDRLGVILPCSKCKEPRYLNLGSYARDVLEVDMVQFDKFILLKDDKYNALIGIELEFKDSKALDLTDFVKS